MTTLQKLALIAAIATCVVLPDSAAFASGSGGGSMSMPSSMPTSRSPEELARSAFNAGVRQIKKADDYLGNAAEATKPEKREKAEKKAAGAYERAAVEFQKAVDNSPSMPEAWNYLGYAQRHLGKHDAALASYARAIKLKPGFPQAIEYRGEAYVELSRFDDARQAYMDLFGRARPFADQLLAFMKKYVADKKQTPDGVSVEALDAFAKWVDERAAIAGQTASLGTSGVAQSWH